MSQRVKQDRVSRVSLILVAAAALFTAAPARADSVTFDRDSAGVKPLGFTSIDSSLVSFWDATGPNDSPFIVMTPFDEGNGTNALVIPTGILLMRFAVPVNALSLMFGNDAPSGTRPGDQALLTAFLDGTRVATARLALNRDDRLNQTIGISGTVLTEATFVFADGVGGAPIPFLGEVVDNIAFSPTPEPATLTLFASGVAIALGVCRRKRRSCALN